MGAIVKEIREENKFVFGYPERMQKLNELGFPWEESTTKLSSRFDVIYLALQEYKREFGNVMVPTQYVVPSGDSRFSESTWNVKLGTRVQSIRAHGTFVANSPEKRFAFCPKI